MERKMSLVHPGEILRMELLEGREQTIEGAAVLLGINKAGLSAILDGRASITPEVSLQICKGLGGSAGFWTRLQSSYDRYAAG